MFRNNWIRVPFIASAIWIAGQLLFHIFSPYPLDLWTIIVAGLIFGFTIQTLNWLRARDKFGDIADKVTDTHQTRILMLMQDKQRALETCELAIESLPNLKLRNIRPESGTAKLRSKMKRVAWVFTWGNLITIKLVEVGEHLTEVNIESRPFMSTVLVDSGETWTTIERLVVEIKKLDSEPSRASLNDGAELLRELTSRPVNFSR